MRTEIPERLFAWYLGDPQQPRLVGEIGRLSNGDASLSYASSWIEQGFALSEDLPLRELVFAPRHRRAREPVAAGALDDARPDRWGDLSRIMCPTLLLWGRHDRFSPPADGLHMAGLIPHSRYVEIPACGHLPSLEAPEEVIDIASHWLKDSGLA